MIPVESIDWSCFSNLSGPQTPVVRAAPIVNPIGDTKWTSASSDGKFRATYACPTCKKVTELHENYVTAGINCCIGRNKCVSIQDGITCLLQVRGWVLVEYLQGSRTVSAKLSFRKTESVDHVCTIGVQSLKNGGDCLVCVNRARIIQKPVGVIMTKPECECSKTQPRKNIGGSMLCVHYNHAVCCPESASEWDYNRNFPQRPELIAVKTHKTYWWICRNDWCGMAYQQAASYRVGKIQTCPYCSGKKVCSWNCLSVTNPELLCEWDPSNVTQPNQVNKGSHVEIKWVCKTDPTHRWIAGISTRTYRGSGCPWCNRAGYAQQMGGHAVFEQISNVVHKNKYSYPGQYQDDNTPVDIFCPVLDKHTGDTHGIFKQTPRDHKSGRGCRRCSKISSKGNRLIESIIQSLGFIRFEGYILEKTFPDLSFQRLLKFDFYILEVNLVIEYDGRQHFISVEGWGGLESF